MTKKTRARTWRRDRTPREDGQLSTIQKDVLRYYGLEREKIEADYTTNKAVHTLVMIGYMDFNDDEILVLTERGDRLMRNVRMPEIGTDSAGN